MVTFLQALVEAEQGALSGKKSKAAKTKKAKKAAKGGGDGKKIKKDPTVVPLYPWDSNPCGISCTAWPSLTARCIPNRNEFDPCVQLI